MLWYLCLSLFGQKIAAAPKAKSEAKSGTPAKRSGRGSRRARAASADSDSEDSEGEQEAAASGSGSDTGGSEGEDDEGDDRGAGRGKAAQKQQGVKRKVMAAANRSAASVSLQRCPHPSVPRPFCPAPLATCKHS